MSNNQDPPIVVSGGNGSQSSSSAIPGPMLSGVLWQLIGTVPLYSPIVITGGDTES